MDRPGVASSSHGLLSLVSARAARAASLGARPRPRSAAWSSPSQGGRRLALVVARAGSPRAWYGRGQGTLCHPSLCPVTEGERAACRCATRLSVRCQSKRVGCPRSATGHSVLWQSESAQANPLALDILSSVTLRARGCALWHPSVCRVSSGGCLALPSAIRPNVLEARYGANATPGGSGPVRVRSGRGRKPRAGRRRRQGRGRVTLRRRPRSEPSSLPGGQRAACRWT